ncbi:hypothetical protein COO60DRAFT_1676403 [Scenedesmus sp. NREL 46B-D3]|nr:hypothetical protein COO60DRAFT_1676403 [Scenedesmus sp. NREL 46B-D3]
MQQWERSAWAARHNGCLDCFAHVQSRNAFCPLCRAPFDPQQQLACNHELKDLMNMANSVFMDDNVSNGVLMDDNMVMDDSTKEEGWEAFPTAKLMAAHYASEVQAQQRSQPLSRLLAGHLAGNAVQQQLAGSDDPSAPALPGAHHLLDYSAANPSGSSGSSQMVVHSHSVAGAQQYNSSSSSSRCLQEHPRLPQSAPSGTQRDVLLMEPPQWLPDSYASHCGACQLPFKPLLRLRHHCRLCGKLFCHGCSSKQLLLPPRFKERDPQRVCSMCASLLEPLQPFLVGATAASVQPPVHDALDAISLRSWLNSPWGGSMAGELYKAANILRKFNEATRLEPERGLPSSLLAGARGLALLSVVRLGAGWSCTAGTGIVVSRQRSGAWSAPCATACYGLGWGLQLGGELTDVLLVLKTDEAVRAFAACSTLGLGGSLGLALGPLGRSAEASFRVGSIAARGSAVGYSCSQGAFVGASLDGSVTCARDAVNKKFYGYAVSARQLLVDCSVPQPPAAAMLYDAAEGLMSRWEGRGLLVHRKTKEAAPAASCSAAAAAGSSSRSSSEAVAVPSKQQQQQQQQQQRQHDGGGADMDQFAAAVFDFEDDEEAYAASAPPAPLSAYGRSSSSSAAQVAQPAAAAASSFSQSGSCQRQQEQEPVYPAVPRTAAAAVAAAESQEEEEVPQYVLEW